MKPHHKGFLWPTERSAAVWLLKWKFCSQFNRSLGIFCYCWYGFAHRCLWNPEPLKIDCPINLKNNPGGILTSAFGDRRNLCQLRHDHCPLLANLQEWEAAGGQNCWSWILENSLKRFCKSNFTATGKKQEQENWVFQSEVNCNKGRFHFTLVCNE